MYKESQAKWKDLKGVFDYNDKINEFVKKMRNIIKARKRKNIFLKNPPAKKKKMSINPAQKIPINPPAKKILIIN